METRTFECSKCHKQALRTAFESAERVATNEVGA